MSRLLRLAVLVAALLFAQLAFALHGVQHLADLDHEGAEVCLQCLALTGSAPLPATVFAAPIRLDAAPERPLSGALPRLTFPAPAYFLTRAPPVRQS